jgi:serine/threonine protein kinase
MSLAPGTRIGPYEVISMVGAGGMGEVYRARDTKLARAVAIKILPDSFANDPERLARFEREARTLASLNHPNIAQIHGFEESDGIKALVMELVEGLTVADRLAQGPIPLDEALPVAKQIAEALAAAHEQGIIHRDLKPANIKVRPDGTVKVLDFGLAKALESVAASSSNSQSPTITSPAMMTHIGVILGTAAYMAPEQAKGRAADRRSDMWAFGCVLYEMLTVGGRSRATMSPTRLRRCCEVSRSGRRFLARRRQRFGGCYVTVWQKIRTHASGMRGPRASKSPTHRVSRKLWGRSFRTIVVGVCTCCGRQGWRWSS